MLRSYAPFFVIFHVGVVPFDSFLPGVEMLRALQFSSITSLKKSFFSPCCRKQFAQFENVELEINNADDTPTMQRGQSAISVPTPLNFLPVQPKYLESTPSYSLYSSVDEERGCGFENALVSRESLLRQHRAAHHPPLALPGGKSQLPASSGPLPLLPVPSPCLVPLGDCHTIHEAHGQRVRGQS